MIIFESICTHLSPVFGSGSCNNVNGKSFRNLKTVARLKKFFALSSFLHFWVFKSIATVE